MQTRHSKNDGKEKHNISIGNIVELIIISDVVALLIDIYSHSLIEIILIMLSLIDFCEFDLVRFVFILQATTIVILI